MSYASIDDSCFSVALSTLTQRLAHVTPTHKTHSNFRRAAPDRRLLPAPPARPRDLTAPRNMDHTPSSRLALAKGFSIQADGAEPDIEAVDTDGTTYSVISGDTDTKAANGLPTRQGFNLPDIGANSAPILISGGSIA